jgi:CRP-like cAMP-binding protein
MNLTQFYFISEPIYNFLDGKEITFLKSVIEERSYPKSVNIFMERTYPKGVYILNSGKVKLYQKTLAGTEQIMNIHVAGEIFGYRPILCDEKYPVSATTVEPCKVSFIPKKHFLRLLHESSAMSNALLRFLSHEFAVWVNAISILAQHSVRERLLLNLLILAEKYKTKKGWPIEITLSRADLAALIGASGETLARALTALKKEQLISSRGRALIINDPAQIDKITKSIAHI